MAEQHKSDDLRKGVKTTKKGEFEKIKKGEIMFFSEIERVALGNSDKAKLFQEIDFFHKLISFPEQFC